MRLCRQGQGSFMTTKHSTHLASLSSHQKFVHDQRCFFYYYVLMLLWPPSIPNRLLLCFPSQDSFMVNRHTKPHVFFCTANRSASIPHHMFFCPPSESYLMISERTESHAYVPPQQRFIHDEQAFQTACFLTSPAIIHDQPAYLPTCFCAHPAYQTTCSCASPAKHHS